jgi:hypothetical protein
MKRHERKDVLFSCNATEASSARVSKGKTSNARGQLPYEPPTAAYYSKGKTRRQSLVISTTVQPFALASSSALSSFPIGELRS